MVKIALIAFVFLFKWYGFVIGLILLTIYLARLKSFNRPYLYPLIPFSFKNIIKQLTREPYIIKEKTK